MANTTPVRRGSDQARDRLLVIEDDPLLCEAFVAALGREGYEVVGARSLGQALGVLADTSFDLVVTDLELPDGSALELVRSLSGRSSAPPVLIASGKAREEDITSGIAAGARDFLVKPFPLSLLTSKVEHYLLQSQRPLAELLPGGTERAFGRFRVGDAIGRGGQGIVYTALDLQTGLEVALKVYQPTREARAEQRILREAYAMARVQHPALAEIVAHGQGDYCYLAMRLIPGPTLGELIRTSGPLSPRDTRALLGRLAEGLAAIHAANLVHRDVKPDNIILREGDPSQPVLTDFGLAKLTYDQALTLAGKVCGTPRFMSPEQVFGEEITLQSDLFSLGLVGCFAVSGRLHFPGLEGVALAKAIATRPIRLPATEEPLRGALASLLKISRHRRLASSSALLELLQQGD